MSQSHSHPHKPAALFTTTFHAPLEKVWATIIDLPAYNTWLPLSPVYKGTTSTSDTPIKLGTTYIEVSPMATRYGRVLELEAPGENQHASSGDGANDDAAPLNPHPRGKVAKVVFEQPMKTGPAFLGLQIGIRVAFRLWEEDHSDEGVAVTDDENVRQRRGPTQQSRVTIVERRVDVVYPFLQSLFSWWLDIRFETESRRTMDIMKAYVEGTA